MSILLQHRVAYQAAIDAISTQHHPQHAVNIKQAPLIGHLGCGHIASQGQSLPILPKHLSLGIALVAGARDGHYVPRTKVFVGLQSHAGLRVGSWRVAEGRNQ